MITASSSAVAGSYCAPYAALPPSYTDLVHIGTGTDRRRCLGITSTTVVGLQAEQRECVGVPAQEWKMLWLANDKQGESSWYVVCGHGTYLEESGGWDTARVDISKIGMRGRTQGGRRPASSIHTDTYGLQSVRQRRVHIAHAAERKYR